MTESAGIFAASQHPLTLALLVLPQASILEVASTLDPLRSANRHLGREAFRWRVVSADGQDVPLTCGFSLPAQGGLAAAEGSDLLIVMAGYRQHEAITPALLREVARLARRVPVVGGIDTGPWVLARAGLLEGHRATVHWEELEDFAAAFPGVEVVPDRFVISGNRVTAGGAAPAADLMLHLIRARHGAALALQVAQSFITEARAGGESQLRQPRALRLRDGRVARMVAEMEARLEAPEPVALLAARQGLSVRRAEGLFRTEFGLCPGAYQRGLRLALARRLLEDTRHDLAVVAERTGFSCASALSRAFKAQYGVSPREIRLGR